jgi:hypothetical protein
MNIFKDISTGASRSLKSWKWILVIWSATLFLVSMLALPMKGEINGILGKSMITEKLGDGLNVDVLVNSGTGLQVLLSSFSTGFMLVVLFGILINVFFNGGLFSVLRKKDDSTGSAGFFAGAASNFWSYLLISVLVVLMISFISFLLIGLPIMIRSGAGSGGSSVVIKITSVIMILVLPVFLLVADYARAWQASNERKNAFIAIGHGFKNTFSHFFSSWAVMFIIVVIQAIFTLLVLKATGDIKPVSSLGIFLMFVLIQALFIIRIFLRAWRYGCVSSMYENHNF